MGRPAPPRRRTSPEGTDHGAQRRSDRPRQRRTGTCQRVPPRQLGRLGGGAVAIDRLEQLRHPGVGVDGEVRQRLEPVGEPGTEHRRVADQPRRGGGRAPAIAASVVRSSSTPSPVAAEVASTRAPRWPPAASRARRSARTPSTSVDASSSMRLSTTSSTSACAVSSASGPSWASARAYLTGSRTQTTTSTRCASRAAVRRWLSTTESWSGRSSRTSPGGRASPTWWRSGTSSQSSNAVVGASRSAVAARATEVVGRRTPSTATSRPTSALTSADLPTPVPPATRRDGQALAAAEPLVDLASQGTHVGDEVVVEPPGPSSATVSRASTTPVVGDGPRRLTDVSRPRRHRRSPPPRPRPGRPAETARSRSDRSAATSPVEPHVEVGVGVGEQLPQVLLAEQPDEQRLAAGAGERGDADLAAGEPTADGEDHQDGRGGDRVQRGRPPTRTHLPFGADGRDQLGDVLAPRVDRRADAVVARIGVVAPQLGGGVEQPPTDRVLLEPAARVDPARSSSRTNVALRVPATSAWTWRGLSAGHRSAVPSIPWTAPRDALGRGLDPDEACPNHRPGLATGRARRRGAGCRARARPASSSGSGA